MAIKSPRMRGGQITGISDGPAPNAMVPKNTAGASSALPFGGLGLSGNHRPAAAFSVDSCAAPIAHLEESSDAAAVPDGALWDDTWLG